MPDEPNPTRPSDTTQSAEEDDARVHSAPDRMPTPDEEAAAERAGESRPEVAEQYEEAMERGAEQEGEGRLP
jgi:hypothetical protein